MGAALTQLRRIYGQAFASEDEARAAITAAPGRLADALFAEAADSDDVTSTDAALGYLDGRLAFLGTLVPQAAVDAIRAQFRTRLRAWE